MNKRTLLTSFVTSGLYVVTLSGWKMVKMKGKENDIDENEYILIDAECRSVRCYVDKGIRNV